MGIMLTIGIIGVVLFLLTLIAEWKVVTSANSLMAIPWVGSIISIAAPIIFFVFVAFDVALMDKHRVEETAQRNVISRLLKEDYNIGVLQSALDFNATQNICKYKQATFAWKYLGTNGVCLDTLVIPESKFTPTSNVNLTVKQ